MSKKQAIILFFCAIFVGILLIQPFNYLCRASGWCDPIIVSYYLPKKMGTRSFDIILEAKNLSKTVDFSSTIRSAVVLSGEDVEVKFLARNPSDQSIKIRPRPYIVPVEAAKYIKFYDCLCFKETSLKAKKTKELSVKFRIDPKIEKDEFFNNVQIIRIGYELAQ